MRVSDTAHRWGGSYAGRVHPPSVDTLARSLPDCELPHPILVDVAREAIAAGDHEAFGERVAMAERRLLGGVINATGVLLHTNLGRAPLAHSQQAGYSNLELDLASGQRGSRQTSAGALLARAGGAEAAIVVNNCAAAVTLALAAIAAPGAVPVSRGELVEIGGGFRVPDVITQSGARLIEIGTTNRTRFRDVEHAIATHDDVTAVLKVHPSNYRMLGFTEEVPVRELATLDVPVLVDLGSGLLDEACPWLQEGRPSWLGDEPAVRQTLEQGADLVMFSGDKLLGGPQAGIIAGRADLVEQCGRHPLMRAFRPGSLVIAALQQVALAYLRREGSSIPFWNMASLPVDDLRQRATAIGVGRVAEMDAAPGGGSLPTATIASAGVVVDGDHAAALRAADPPIIARVADQQTHLDLRTVAPEHDAHLAEVLAGL